MYVTQLIKNEKIRKILEKELIYPNIEINTLKYFNNPDNYSLIGHAYEILFQIEYMKKNKMRNIFFIKAFRKINLLNSIKESTEKKAKKINKILIKLKKIEKEIYRYIFEDKKIKYKNIIYLANINNIRTKKDLFFNKKNIKNNNDLKELKKGIKKFKWLFKEQILFNTNVSKNDIYGEIDIKHKDFILDIKTTSEGKVTKYMINQLILYYLLSKSKDYKPKKIGILFSRYGKIKFVKIRDILSKKKEKLLWEQLLKEVV